MIIGKAKKEENSGKAYDYTSMQGQIRVHRVLLLAVTTMIAIGAIYFRNMYLEIQEHHQLISAMFDCIDSQQEVIYSQQEVILRLDQTISDLAQNVYNLYTSAEWR